MANCLVTKLKAEVNNDNLPKLGVIEIKYTQQNTAGNILIKSAVGTGIIPVTISVDSGSFKVDSGLSESVTSYTFADNLEHNIIMSNTACNILIENKYSLIGFVWRGTDPNLELDINQFNYCDKLEGVELRGATITGSLSALSRKQNLKYIILQRTGITGDLSDIQYRNLIGQLVIDGSNSITGNISALSSSSNLNKLLLNTKVTGDISVLADKVHLNQLEQRSAYTDGISGSILNLKNCTKLTTVVFSYTSVTGALEDLASEMGANRNSGTLLISGGGMTYNGASIGNISSKTINFNVTPPVIS